MKRTSLASIAAVMTLTAALAACGSDKATSPLGGTGADTTAAPLPPDGFSPTTAEVNQDIAPSIGDGVAADVEALTTSQDDQIPFLGAQGAPGGSAHGSCDYSAAHGFSCQASTVGTVTTTGAYRLFDAQSVEQAQYDDATTATVVFHYRASGSITKKKWSAEFSRQRDDTLSGLVGAETERTWNGVGADTVTTTHTPGPITRTFSLASVDTVSGVVFRLPRASHPYPVSGTVVRSVVVTKVKDGKKDLSSTSHSRVVVTFDGNQAVPMTVGALACTLDLSTHDVTNCH
jgi:hypothetical protein